jgi:hypothetical protein
MGSGGVDLSVFAEYSLFDFLLLGGTLTHIPIYPAVLNNRMHAELTGDRIEPSIENSNVDMDYELKQTYDTSSYTVYRPLRFGVYALLVPPLPLLEDFLTVRPNLGFTTLNASDSTYVNWGIDLQVNLLDHVFITIGTGLEEDLWKHRLGLLLDLWIPKLLIEASLRSQEFTRSFSSTGASITLGLSFGIGTVTKPAPKEIPVEPVDEEEE